MKSFHTNSPHGRTIIRAQVIWSGYKEIWQGAISRRCLILRTSSGVILTGPAMRGFDPEKPFLEFKATVQPDFTDPNLGSYSRPGKAKAFLNQSFLFNGECKNGTN